MAANAAFLQELEQWSDFWWVLSRGPRLDDGPDTDQRSSRDRVWPHSGHFGATPPTCLGCTTRQSIHLHAALGRGRTGWRAL